VNIHDLLNKSRGDVAYTLVDTDTDPGSDVLNAICSIDGVQKVRLIQPRG